MDILSILIHPFSLGTMLGLLFAIFIYINGNTKIKNLNYDLAEAYTEIRKLKDHLYTQMQINARGNENLIKENESLKERNKNLEISLANLETKPGRKELMTLGIFDNAIRSLTIQAPGFAQAWENAMIAAESEMKEARKGFRPILRKIFRNNSLLPDNSAVPASKSLGNEIDPEKARF
jgi:regulator of replication initiation timing